MSRFNCNFVIDVICGMLVTAVFALATAVICIAIEFIGKL